MKSEHISCQLCLVSICEMDIARRSAVFGTRLATVCHLLVPVCRVPQSDCP